MWRNPTNQSDLTHSQDPMAGDGKASPRRVRHKGRPGRPLGHSRDRPYGGTSRAGFCPQYSYHWGTREIHWTVWGSGIPGQVDPVGVTWRTLWQEAASQELGRRGQTNSKAPTPSSRNSGSTVPMGKLDGFRSNTLCRLSRKWTSVQSVPDVRSPWTVGRGKKGRKKERYRPPGNSWKGHTWSSGTHCWCASRPSPNSHSSMSSSKTWRTGIVSFGEKTLQIASHLPARQCYCMLRETLGARSTTRSMRDPPSKRPWQPRRLTLSFGRERCMRGSQNHKTEHKALRGTHHPQRARAKPSRHGHRHRTNGPRANRPRKGSPGETLKREKTPIGPRTGPQPPRGGCSTAKTISFVTSTVETVADHMDAL